MGWLSVIVRKKSTDRFAAEQPLRGCTTRRRLTLHTRHRCMQKQHMQETRDMVYDAVQGSGLGFGFLSAGDDTFFTSTHDIRTSEGHLPLHSGAATSLR